MEYNKLTEKDVGRCICVSDSTDFFMIGYVHPEFHVENDSDTTEFRGKFTYYISADKKFSKDAIWCYVASRRGYREATEKQKYWLDVCIAANKYIPEKEALKNYNLISEPQIFN